MRIMLSILLVCLSGYAARGSESSERLDALKFLREADQITVYSLHPQQIHEVDEHNNPTEADKKKERLWDYPVLGKVVTSDAQTRESVRQAVIASLTSVKDGPPLLGFEPRHAICLRKGSQHVDLLLCYQWGQAQIHYIADNFLYDFYFGIGPDGEDVLNELLDSRKIPREIPKKSKGPNPEDRATPAPKQKSG